jgi:DNA-directed RNA polymerase specialized sigma24 family protein
MQAEFTERTRQFQPTRWSVILAAGDLTHPERERALEELCGAYWLPVYAYIRRTGRGGEDAQDLTQQFFLTLLSRDALRTADPACGRFRSFLLTGLQRFLVSEWRRQTAARRFSPEPPADLAELERGLAAGAGDGESPDLRFEADWADSLLARALARVRASYEKGGRAELFDVLKPFIWGAASAGGTEAAAVALGLGEGAARVAVHRLRQRFRETLREEVAATVEDPSAVDGELRYLIRVLARSEP